MASRMPLRLRLAVLPLLLCLLAGCDPFANKRPYNYPFSLWVSEDGSACFAVTDDPTLQYTELERRGTVRPLFLNFYPGRAGGLYDLAGLPALNQPAPRGVGDYLLWRGFFRFGSRKCTIESTQEGTSALLFTDDQGNEMLPLAFYRTDHTPEELDPLLPWTEDGTLREDFVPGALLALAREDLAAR